MIKKLLVLLFTILITLSHFSQAAQPDSYTQFGEYLDLSSTNKTYDVFFPYGNQYLTKDVENSSVSLTFSKNSLDVVKDSYTDYYLSEDLINLAESIPRNKFLDCSLVSKYKETFFKGRSDFGKRIPTKFISGNNLVNYGPQSETEKSTIKQGVTGCIGFSVKLNNSAKSGDLVDLVFNQNINFSSSYEEINRPGISTVSMIITDNNTGCDITKGEVFVNSKCVPRCESNQILDYQSASCIVKIRECFPQEENILGQCLQKCQEGFYRQSNGVCRNPIEVSKTDSVTIYSKEYFNKYLIYIGPILGLATLLVFAIKKIKKNTK
ncbi:MAG: hypothetical protein ACRCXZ_00215 [Patescibacteria group bacterium]